MDIATTPCPKLLSKSHKLQWFKFSLKKKLANFKQSKPEFKFDIESMFYWSYWSIPNVTYPWYMDVWNRLWESKIHDIHKIGSGTKERDTQSFYADCFYIVSSQPNQHVAPVAHKFVWPRQALKVNFLLPRQELNSLLFLKSQNPQSTLPVRNITDIPWSQFQSRILFWHLWMTHPLRMHMNTCVNVAPN